jgi:hypothetical protein
MMRMLWVAEALMVVGAVALLWEALVVAKANLPTQ